MSAPGDQFEATVGFDRLNEAQAMNERASEHLWIVAATFGLTAEEAAHASAGARVLLDRDHLLALTQIGCWICEKPYDEALKDKRCKGSPVRHADSGDPCYADGTTGSGGRWRK